MTFKQRLDRLRSAATNFFAARNLAELETEFREICVAAEGFAKRRNEVAHSVVFPSFFLPSFMRTGSEASTGDGPWRRRIIR